MSNGAQCAATEDSGATVNRQLSTDNRYSGTAFVVASAVAFGAMAIFARFATRDGADTTGLLAVRFAIAGAFLIVLGLVMRVRWPGGRDLAILAALGGVGYAAQAASFFSALELAPAGLAAAVLLARSPT